MSELIAFDKTDVEIAVESQSLGTYNTRLKEIKIIYPDDGGVEHFTIPDEAEVYFYFENDNA